MIGKDIPQMGISISPKGDQYSKAMENESSFATIDTRDKFSHGESEKLSLIPKPLRMETHGVATAEVASANDGDKAKILPRMMTEEEKANFKEYFPKLDVDKAVVTDEAVPDYNCISWTVGETHHWFWPPQMYPG